MAFNEKDSLPAQVRETLNFLDAAVAAGQVVVVDDGSTDGTGKLADDLAGQDARVTVVHHPRNLGMGAAIRSGYGAATCEWVSQLPGDGQISPDTLERFLRMTGDHDLVLSTYDRRGDGVLRTLVTSAYQAAALAILGDRCRFTGTMMFRRSWLDQVRLASDSFIINVELPLKLMRLGVTPGWVSIGSPLPRAHGRSKVLTVGRIAIVLREMVSLKRELGVS
jgi:glycosyltransferase involved in cell wall biosynthesis